VSRAPEDLLTLALPRPHDAISGEQLLLGSGPPQFTASKAHRAGGIRLRQLGDVDTAIRQMRPALRLAEQSGHRRRELDALATLGRDHIELSADRIAPLNKGLGRILFRARSGLR
jgi:hypothetical protein